MRLLEGIDPYDHPRGIHNVRTPNDDYIDSPYVDFTAIQTGSPGGNGPGALSHNQLTIDWIDRCKERGKRILVVNYDEGRPEQDRRAWWSVYLGGGVWEAHVTEPYDRPMSAWEPVWSELGGARAFMESLPFWEMAPRNELVMSGEAFCLAKPGEAYALYLPAGGSVTLRLPDDGQYTVQWWNPANGRDGEFQDRARISGRSAQLKAPGDGDWAVRVVKE